jgi:hypothetical protein
MRHRWFAHNYSRLLIQLAIGLAVYGFGLAWAVWTRRAWQVREISRTMVEEAEAVELVETYQQQG